METIYGYVEYSQFDKTSTGINRASTTSAKTKLSGRTKKQIEASRMIKLRRLEMIADLTEPGVATDRQIISRPNRNGRNQQNQQRICPLSVRRQPSAGAQRQGCQQGKS